MSSGIAVVITCYELGRTLEEAVESVRGQTLPPEEILVVDDGSRDPFTRHALAKLEEQGVMVIWSEHAGPAHARNGGVDSTRAPLVVLLDGDDLFEPTYLERAAATLAKNSDLDFVCCSLQAFGLASYRWTPPSYSLAESIGRGACGHVSTVFRRELWEAVGGFDHTFPAAEDLDFWLRALELGFRGVVLDEALVRYRVRGASRYHAAVVRGDYLAAKEQLIDKHFHAIAPRGEAIFLSLLEFQREQSGHARSLAQEQRRLGDEIAVVEREVSEAQVAIRNVGSVPFSWGEVGQRASEARNAASNAIETFYVEALLAELGQNGRRKHRLTIRRGDAWPEATSAFDSIVVAGALEYEDDPLTALRHCRDALRARGELIVAASPMATGRRDGFGLTEASLRALLSELFPPATVEVTTRGNLLTCIASVAGMPLSSLGEAELRRVDPWHPTLLVAVARVPEARRSRRPSGSKSRKDRPSSRTRGVPHTDRGVILAYHRIASLTPDTHGLCTPPEVFERHMESVAEDCDVLPLQELVSRAGEGTLPSRAVAITFDDGYVDHLEVVSPLLSRLGLPATFFINGDRLDEEREGLWDTVERILAGDESVPHRLQIGVGGVELDLPTRSDEERAAALLALHGWLLDADAAGRQAFLADLAGWSGLDLGVRPTHRLLTASDVVRLSKNPGQEIGAHGLHHLLLTAHLEEVRRHELAESQAVLERLLGRPVRTLAYAYGACDFATTVLAEELGFTAACTVDPDPVTPDSDPLRLPRIEVGPELESLQFRLDRLLSGE